VLAGSRGAAGLRLKYSGPLRQSASVRRQLDGYHLQVNHPSMRSSAFPATAACPISSACICACGVAGTSSSCGAFDLLHQGGRGLRALPLTEHQRRLKMPRSDLPCLPLVEAPSSGVACRGKTEASRLINGA
jgi:hypothetical protein